MLRGVFRVLAVLALTAAGGATVETGTLAATDRPAASPTPAAEREQAIITPAGARLIGRVTDIASNPLPGVEVTVRGAGASRTVVTDGEGRYQFEGLAPGPYAVAGELVGFQNATGTIALAAFSEGATLDLVMKVGCIEEHIIVMMPLEHHVHTADAVARVRVVSRGEPRQWTEELPCRFAGTEYVVSVEDSMVSRSARWPASGTATIVRAERELVLGVGAEVLVFLRWSEGLNRFVSSDEMLWLHDGRLATNHYALAELRGLSMVDAAGVIRHLASRPAPQKISAPSLGDLTVSPERLLPGCAITPRVSEPSADGKVTGGLWAGLPISDNPWQGTDPVVAGQIHERMFAPPISDAPLPSRRELAMSRLKGVEDVVESYAAIYRDSASGALTTVTALRFEDAEIAARWWRQRSFHGMQSILEGALVATVSGAGSPCMPVIAAHVRSVRQ
jgi:hypothetical protein